MKFFRGCFFAVLIGLPFWAIVVAILYFLLRP